ncbi:MAG: hypothetical protein JNM55_21085 [Anaerolineales bacterium]|nr:hypothetical protein [Anaerolineales bacterium]
MTDYNQRIEQYISRYSSLVKYAEELAFPAHSLGMPSQSKKWRWLRRTAYKLSHPFTTMETDIWNVIGYVLLVFLMQSSLGWGIMILAPALYGTPAILTFSNLGGTLSLIIALIFSIPLAYVTYYWWYELFTSEQYRPALRIFLVFLQLILVIGLTEGFRNRSVTGQLMNSSTGVVPLLVSYAIFLIPAATYILIIIFEILVQFKELFTSVSRSIATVHDPLPLDQIKKLALEEIPGSENTMAWRLSSLSLNEIITLRSWAQANQESTDKRTLPAILILTFLALLLNSETVKDVVEPAIKWWWQECSYVWTAAHSSPSNIFSWEYLAAILVFAVTLIITKKILRTFSRLFKNFPVQSLVVEACILAERAHDENFKIQSELSPKRQRPVIISILENLFDIFKK